MPIAVSVVVLRLPFTYGLPLGLALTSARFGICVWYSAATTAPVASATGNEISGFSIACSPLEFPSEIDCHGCALVGLGPASRASRGDEVCYARLPDAVDVRVESVRVQFLDGLLKLFPPAIGHLDLGG